MTWTTSPLWAEIYDMFHPVGESIGDVEYYLSRLGDKRLNVLEPACGNGRFMIPLLRAGHDVAGSDISADMIAVCEKNCAAEGLQPHLYTAGLTETLQPEAFDAIVLPRGSLRQIDNEEDCARTIGAFFDGLRPGGRVVIDVRILPKFEVGPPQVRFEYPFMWSQQDFHVEVRNGSQTVTIFARYEKWANGSLVDSRVHRFAVRQWELDEVVALLQRVGFVDVGVVADYNPIVHLDNVRNYYTVEATKPH